MKLKKLITRVRRGKDEVPIDKEESLSQQSIPEASPIESHQEQPPKLLPQDALVSPALSTITPVVGLSAGGVMGLMEDSAPWGLKVLYPGRDPIIDVVAIHGLNGHREKTWTTEDGNVLWLRDLLPEKLPNARVLTWGYDSRTHSKNHRDHLTTKKLYDHGRELIFDLDSERREGNIYRRPIIFVAHSLGGIVVKNALLHSDRVRKGHLEEQRSIKLSTYGIIFMGTPHQGGQGVSIGKILLNITKACSNTSDDLLKHLEEHSELLQHQISEFTSISQDFEIKFVYETKPTPLIGVATKEIVPKWSAVVPGTPDAAEFGIDEDHRRMTKFSSVEDQGFKKLSRVLVSMAQKAVSKVEANWSSERQAKLVKLGDKTFDVPFSIRGLPSVGQYVARDCEMERLERSLLPEMENKQQKIFVLHGLGGIGKTQLSIAFTRKHRSSYTAIFWLDGQTRESLKRSIAGIAKRLPPCQISESARRYGEQSIKPVDEVIEEVMGWLCETGNNKWLLVYDNVDRDNSPEILDPEAYDISEYLPQADQGSIIITTRQFRLRNWGEEMKLKEMTVQESLRILETRMGRPVADILDAHELVDRLGCLPLALAQAASYMRETNTGITEYLKYYRTTWHDLMKGEANPASAMREYGNRSIYTTWTLSYEYVKQKDDAAARMLQVWAYLDNRDIWFGLFNSKENPDLRYWSNPPDWFNGVVRNVLGFKRAVRTLLAYSLIEEKQDSDAYAVHPVVHEWCREALSINKRQESLSLAITSVGFALPRGGEVGAWLTRLRLLPHADRCSRLFTSNFGSSLDAEMIYDVFNAADRIGTFYFEQGKLAEAGDMYQRALAGQEKALGLDHGLTLAIAHHLGMVYTEMDKLAEAEAMYQRVLAGREKTLGPDHVSTLAVVHNMGILYERQDRLAEAEAMYQRDLAGQEKSLRLDHISTLITIHNLGMLYTKWGNLAKAEATYHRALEGEERALGLDNTWTLNTVHNLGILYSKQGKLVEAEAMYQRALAGWEKTVGLSNAFALGVVRSLADLYTERGKLVEAEAMYQRALSGMEKALGPKNSLTLAIVHNLGILYSKQDKLVEAETMYRRASAGFEMALGPDHTSTLEVFRSMGDLYMELGKLVEAEDMYLRALTGQGEALGPDNISTLGTVHSLGTLYRRQDKLVEAEAMYQRALAGQERALEPGHTSILRTMNNLADLYNSQDRIQEAEALYQRVSAGEMKALGPNHPSTSDAVNALADIYRKLGKTAEADALLEQAQAEHREDEGKRGGAEAGAGDKC